MSPVEYPKFIQALPEADIPLTQIQGRLLQAEAGQVLFLKTDEKVVLPEHAHGDQWGLVVDGQVQLTIGGETRTYSKGDSYFIPAGVKHGGILFPGFRAIDVFADRDRYQVRGGK